MQQLKDVKLKKQILNSVSALTQQRELANKDLQNSLSDRKTVTKEYIMSRFPNDYRKYRDTLSELKIL